MRCRNDREVTMTVLDDARRLSGVRHGMRVLDRAGTPVGYVCAVRRADHLSVGGGHIGSADDLVAMLPHARTEPRVASAADAARLVRLGYIKVDGRHVDRLNRYALAAEIDGIDEGVVLLTVAREDLPVEVA
jgi:hypothetical protein